MTPKRRSLKSAAKAVEHGDDRIDAFISETRKVKIAYKAPPMTKQAKEEKILQRIRTVRQEKTDGEWLKEIDEVDRIRKHIASRVGFKSTDWTKMKKAQKQKTDKLRYSKRHEEWLEILRTTPGGTSRREG